MIITTMISKVYLVVVTIHVWSNRSNDVGSEVKVWMCGQQVP